MNDAVVISDHVHSLILQPAHQQSLDAHHMFPVLCNECCVTLITQNHRRIRSPGEHCVTLKPDILQKRLAYIQHTRFEY